MEKFYNEDFLKQLQRLSLRTKKLKAGIQQGERRSPRKGHSVEFADFRSYSLGDDVRYIDWNSYARSEKLFIKLFVEEQDLLLNIFMDTSQSMDWGQPSKSRLAKQIAGAFAYMALSAYDQVAIAACSEHLYSYQPPLGGRNALRKVWGFLDALPVIGSTRLSDSIKEFGPFSRRPGVSLIISDLLSPHDFKEGLKYLQYLKQEVILLQILAPDELSPVLHGDWRLLDSESKEIREISINTALLKAYEKKIREFTAETREFCHRRGMAFIQICSDELLEDIILRSMPRAGILG